MPATSAVAALVAQVVDRGAASTSRPVVSSESEAMPLQRLSSAGSTPLFPASITRSGLTGATVRFQAADTLL